MSEPVTNVEIEDVLSSIRKLVSDGDKARTRDPAPAPVPDVAPEDRLAQQVNEATARLGESKTDKLVLTPALMVVGGDSAPGKAEKAPVQTEDTKAEDVAAPQDTDADTDQEPVQLTEMVWDAEEPKDAALSKDETRSVDRAELVATIAELEAAIASDVEDYDPDESDLKAETIEWPSPAAQSFDDIEDAETSDDSSFVDVEPSEEGTLQEATPTDTVEDASFEDVADAEDLSEASAFEGDDQAFEFVHQSSDTLDAPIDVNAEAQPVGTAAADVYEDDDLDDLLEDGAAGLDQEALRTLVAHVVREELTGPLGEKITRNVRKLVRREIYRILSSKDFD